MKQIHFVKLLFVALFVGAGMVPIWGYTITFKSTTGSDGSTAQTEINNVVSDGSSYLSTISCTKVYNGKSGYGIKLGTSSATGNITLNFSSNGQIKPTKITIKAGRYGSDTGNLNYKINGGSQSSKTLSSTLTDYEITMDGNTTLTSLYLASSTKRIYIVSVSIESDLTETTPSITQHPESATYDQGATPTALTITASGNPTPTYQWYSNTSKNNSNGTAISGATKASYTPSTATAGTFYYYCVATNSKGSASSNVATITVNTVTTYTVTWMVGGQPYTEGNPTTSVASGSKVSTLPTPPADNSLSCAEKFMGWSAQHIGTDPKDNAPADLFTTIDASPAITENTTFYAVFASPQK